MEQEVQYFFGIFVLPGFIVCPGKPQLGFMHHRFIFKIIHQQLEGFRGQSEIMLVKMGFPHEQVSIIHKVIEFLFIKEFPFFRAQGFCLFHLGLYGDGMERNKF